MYQLEDISCILRDFYTVETPYREEPSPRNSSGVCPIEHALTLGRDSDIGSHFLSFCNM